MTTITYRAGATVFRDRGLERRFREEGYVVAPLLDDHGIGSFGALLGELGPAPGDPGIGLFNDSWSTDPDYKRRLCEGIDALLQPGIDRLVEGYRPLISATSKKWPGPEGEVVAHRDPTFVDETEFRSLGVWCALRETTTADGTLRVLPGSHRLDTEVRVHQAPSNLYPEADRDGRLVDVPLPAGHAILYDHTLIHGSAPNTGHHPRTVLMTMLVPTTASTFYAVRTSDSTATVFSADTDFYLSQRLNCLDLETLRRDHHAIYSFPFP
ncbi:MAG: phytanoyl-CoA dioxygenase family protein [Microthrixaceae bacterium]